jgi:hypothetical protein
VAWHIQFARRKTYHSVKMPTLAVNDFNIVCATLGSFIAVFGLVSFLFKEKFYLSETRTPANQPAKTTANAGQ